MSDENKKKELVKILNKIADLNEFLGENPFKIKAFRTGANALRSFSGELEDLISSEKPVKIKGIGKGILSVIYDFLHNSKITELEKLTEKVPEGITELFEIKGLGIKKIKLLYEELNITNLAELENALAEGKLNELKNFGEKLINQIAEEIEKIKQRKSLMLLDEAEHIADEIVQKLKSVPEIEKVQISGELRLVREIISKVEIVFLANSHEEEIEKRLNNLFVYNKLKDSDNKIIYAISGYGEYEILLYLTKNKNEFTVLNFLLTGSENFVKDFELDETIEREQEIFKKNDIPYVIPEMREQAPSEIKRENSDLCFGEMKGMLHFHTIASDGHNTLEEMISAGKRKGFVYFAVCDHSKSAFYANGLNEERLLEQKNEIKALSEKFNDITILHGNETDILADGSLDFDNDLLASLDFVVASVHSRFNLDKEEMTRRIVKAVENPYVTVLGHPTGRLLLRRKPYEIDIRKIIDACVANGVAIEINANPWRLDLDWRNFDYAKEKGALFSINADAHSTEEIANTKYGVKIARKGGIMQSEVINYWSADKLTDFVRSKRPR